jgi:hypothetical protein
LGKELNADNADYTYYAATRDVPETSLSVFSVLPAFSAFSPSVPKAVTCVFGVVRFVRVQPLNCLYRVLVS